MSTARVLIAALVGLLVAGCGVRLEKDRISTKDFTNFLSPEPPPPVIRQPVLPELLKACRGHVLVPALGMKFVARGAEAPSRGQFLREESLSPPYRIIAPNKRLSAEQSPARLNVELDAYGRIVGLYCG